MLKIISLNCMKNFTIGIGNNFRFQENRIKVNLAVQFVFKPKCWFNFVFKISGLIICWCKQLSINCTKKQREGGYTLLAINNLLFAIFVIRYDAAKEICCFSRRAAALFRKIPYIVEERINFFQSPIIGTLIIRNQELFVFPRFKECFYRKLIDTYWCIRHIKSSDC